MVTLVSSARTGAPLKHTAIAAAMAVRPRPRGVNDVMWITSALQRRVDDGEALIAGLEVDAGDAEHRAKLVVGDLHRSGRRGTARRGLREGGRARGVERHVAFDLLHHLVDVAVQHRHRAEALEVV